MCVMRLYLRGVIVIILGRGGGGGVQAKRLRQGLALSWDTKVRSAWRQIHDRQKTFQLLVLFMLSLICMNVSRKKILVHKLRNAHHIN